MPSVVERGNVLIYEVESWMQLVVERPEAKEYNEVVEEQEQRRHTTDNHILSESLSHRRLVRSFGGTSIKVSVSST